MMEYGGIGLTMRQERSQRGVAGGDHGWLEFVGAEIRGRRGG